MAAAAVERDVVLKSGWLYKRGKGKTWSRKWLVLRSNQLAVYKDEREYQAEKIIQTGDIMSAAVLDDPQRANHFAVFTSNANLHLRADNHPDAQEWVDVLRHAANDACESIIASSYKRDSVLQGQGFDPTNSGGLLHTHVSGVDTSAGSSQVNRLSLRRGDSRNGVGPLSIPPPAVIGPAQPVSPPMAASPTSGGYFEFSGTEAGMSSCTSDRDPTAIGEQKIARQPTVSEAAAAVAMHSRPDDQEEKVLKRGQLLRLRKRLSQWKKQWIVITTHRILLYKSEQNKQPQRVIDASRVLDAIEIDPLSKSKIYCLQVVTPEKRIRFCAGSEEELTSWLATFKSIIRG
jgi:hypothetical protein